jgi:hypothetical protein
MVYKMKPLEPIPEQPNPPPEQANSTDGKPARAPRTPRPQPLTRAEVAALVVEMRAELTGDSREEAQKLRHALKLPAMERLGLVITGRQPATAAQVMTASVAIIEDDDPTDKHDAGITADAIKAAE